MKIGWESIIVFIIIIVIILIPLTYGTVLDSAVMNVPKWHYKYEISPSEEQLRLEDIFRKFINRNETIEGIIITNAESASYPL